MYYHCLIDLLCNTIIMETKLTKTNLYAFFGLPGSGSTTALFNYLCKRILDERSKVQNPQEQYEVVSLNRCTAGAYQKCERLCKIIDVPCIQPEETAAIVNYKFAAEKTYFIDLGGDTVSPIISDFFEKMSCTWFTTIPAYIDTAVLGDIMERFSIMQNPQVILSFCDFVSEEKRDAVIGWLTNHGYKLVGKMDSGRLPRGLQLL